MRNTNKKGFTIVELVVVVAVIAILAAVMIPVFSGIIDRANESADIHAVRNMNVALAGKNPSGIVEVGNILSDAGFNTEKGLTPAYKDRAFYWFQPTNQIVYVNEADGKFELIFPENVKDFPAAKNDDCISLEVAINAVVNAPAVSENSTAVGNNINASVSAPEGVDTFEEVATWLNGLTGTQDITCTINGVPGKTGIVLSDDVKLTEDVVVGVYNKIDGTTRTLVVNIVGDVTIDLNGHSITQSCADTSVSAPLFVVNAGATLNIIDSSAEQNGTIYAACTAIQVSTGATVNLYSGKLALAGDEYRHANDQMLIVSIFGGTFNMFGGAIDATEAGYAIGNSQSSVRESATANLYNGNIYGWIDITDIVDYNEIGVTIAEGFYAIDWNEYQ